MKKESTEWIDIKQLWAYRLLSWLSLPYFTQLMPIPPLSQTFRGEGVSVHLESSNNILYAECLSMFQLKFGANPKPPFTITVEPAAKTTQLKQKPSHESMKNY